MRFRIASAISLLAAATLLPEALLWTAPACAQYGVGGTPPPGFGSATGQQLGTPGGAVRQYQPFGAPGSAPGQPWPGTYYMRNQPGVGFYNVNPAYPHYPVFSAPVPLAGGYFGFTGGGYQYRFWKAPSGYYYPWGRRTYFGLVPPILYYQAGVAQASPAEPPLSTVFQDLRKFLDDSHNNSQLSDTDYSSLSQRLNDLMGKERSLRYSGGGSLDEGTEDDLRRDLDRLGEEISRRVKS